jgi:hypothetical protein
MNEITVSDTPARTTIPARVVLAVDGTGPTTTDRFNAAIGALVAARIALGAADGPIEGTYDQREGEFDLDQPDGWVWTLAVEAPEGVGSAPTVGDATVRVEARDAVDVVAVLHRGPYEAEGPSLAALRTFAVEQGLTITGPHSERYLTDPERTAPEDLRTLLWYPVGA